MVVGNPLEEGKTLESYQIEYDQTLAMVYVLPGVCVREYACAALLVPVSLISVACLLLAFVDGIERGR